MAIRRSPYDDPFGYDPSSDPYGYYQDQPPDSTGGGWNPTNTNPYMGGQTGPAGTSVQNQTPPPAPAPAPAPSKHYLSAYSGGNDGWNIDKLNDTTHDTSKYQIGRIADQFDPNAIRKDASAFNSALKNAGFNARQIGDDKWDFGGDIGVVDLLRGDGSWWWGQEGPPQAQMPPPGQSIPVNPGGGAPGGGGGGGNPGQLQGFGGDLKSILAGLFPNGAFNQDALTRRVSNLSDILNRNRKSQLATTQAALAQHGQGVNDGTYGSSMGNLETRLNENFNQGVNEAYANESDLASQRMMKALELSTGMSAEEAKNAVDMARIGADERIAQGQLGLGYHKADQDYTLGQGNLGLGSYSAQDQAQRWRSELSQAGNSASMDNMIKLIELYMNGANIGSGGHY